MIFQMHKIYFDWRSIVICTPEESALTDPNAVEFHAGNRIDLGRLVSSRRSMLPAAWFPTGAATTC